MDAEQMWFWDSLNRKQFKVDVGGDGRLLAKGPVGTAAPVAVLSIPKAGTYLVAALLERLGYVDSELHVAQTHLSDYRGLSIDQKRRDYADHIIAMPIEISAGLVGPGQFLVGHLHRNATTEGALASFRKILVYRNLIDATVSHMRFMADSGRAAGQIWANAPDGPHRLLGFLDMFGVDLFEYNYKPIMRWLEGDAFVISYEVMMGDAGPESQRERFSALGEYLGVTGTEVFAIFRDKVMGRPTKTLSSARTQLELYWTPEVRQAFRKLGADDFNAVLGYAAQVGEADRASR